MNVTKAKRKLRMLLKHSEKECVLCISEYQCIYYINVRVGYIMCRVLFSLINSSHIFMFKQSRKKHRKLISPA